MADRLEFNFVGNDQISALLERLDRVASRLDKVLDHLGDSAAGMGRRMAVAERQVDDLGDEMDSAARSADKLDRKLDDVGRGAGQLDVQIAATKQRIRELADEFERTGDVDIFDKILAERSALARLARIKRAIGEVADEVGDAARIATRSFGDAIGALPSQLKGTLIVGAVAAAAASAPFIGAAIGSAVLGGVGVGGIIGGVALAAQDSRVGIAAAGVAERIGKAFLANQGGAFVGPTLDALEILAAAAERFAKTIDLSVLAQEVAPLAEGFAHFADTIMPGVNEALEAAKPVIRVIARELPHLGAAISDMLQTISRESDGAILGLAALFDLIEGGVRIAGQSIAFLSRQWENLVRGLAAFSGAGEDIWGWIPVVGDRFRDTNDKTETWLRTLDSSKEPINAAADTTGRLALELQRQARAADEAADALDRLADTGQDIRLAELNVRDAIARLSEAVKEHGTSLDINTEHGRANLRIIERAIDAADEAGNAAEERALAEGKSAAAAAAAGAVIREQWIAALQEEAAKAGFATSEIAKLVAAHKAADGTRIKIYQDIILSTIDRRDSKLDRKPFSAGGPVRGPGPRGVDSVAALLAPGEYVLRADVVERLGMRNLDLLNAGQSPPVVSAPAVAPGPVAAAVPTELVVRVVLQYPDGRQIAQEVGKAMRQTGQRTLTAFFDYPAS